MLLFVDAAAAAEDACEDDRARPRIVKSWREDLIVRSMVPLNVSLAGR